MLDSAATPRSLLFMGAKHKVLRPLVFGPGQPTPGRFRIQTEVSGASRSSASMLSGR